MYELFNQSLFLRNALEIYSKQNTHIFLEKIAYTLAERISWTLKKYERILILGPYSYVLEKALNEICPYFLNTQTLIQFKNIVFESEKIPFKCDSFDCVLSFFDMQTINDVPGYLKQIDYILIENGLFNAVFLGNDSLGSLKKYLLEKELMFHEGAAIRFHPTITIEDSANLLSRAGFDCPLVDYNRYYLDQTFSEFVSILRSLKSTSILKNTPSHISKQLMHILLNDDLKIPVTIEFIFMTALGKRKKNSFLPSSNSSIG